MMYSVLRINPSRDYHGLQRVLTVRAGNSIYTRTKTSQTYPLKNIAHKRKLQEGYTLAHFIDGFLFGGCLRVHLSTV